MLDKDDMTRDTLRMFKSEVQKFEIDNQETVDDAKALSIINKMIKQRNDSIAQFTNGGRSDLAEKEQLEVNVLSKYKPTQKLRRNCVRDFLQAPFLLARNLDYSISLKYHAHLIHGF